MPCPLPIARFPQPEYSAAISTTRRRRAVSSGYCFASSASSPLDRAERSSPAPPNRADTPPNPDAHFWPVRRQTSGSRTHDRCSPRCATIQCAHGNRRAHFPRDDSEYRRADCSIPGPSHRRHSAPRRQTSRQSADTRSVAATPWACHSAPIAAFMYIAATEWKKSQRISSSRVHTTFTGLPTCFDKIAASATWIGASTSARTRRPAT